MNEAISIKNNLIIRPYLKLFISLNILILAISIPLFIFRNDVGNGFPTVAWVLLIWSLILPFFILLINSPPIRIWYIFNSESIYITRKDRRIFYSEIIAAEYITPSFKSKMKAHFFGRRSELHYNIPGVLRVKSINAKSIEIPVGKKKLQKIASLTGIKIQYVSRLSF